MASVEIAIVTMNRPEVFRDTAKHLESQGLLEKLLVVDGSKDDKTKDICDEHGIEYHRQDSKGMTSARNEALEHCGSEYIVFIDDDVRISDTWYDAICEAFDEGNIVGVTGKLENDGLDMGGFAKKVRNFLFGGIESFGEVLDNGVINGDFFYDERREVDHMPGCNMAHHVPTLKEVGGFQEEYDVGNSYREDTIASYLVGQEGKIVYEPGASLEHLAVDEEGDKKNWMFYNPYLTKYFLHSNSIVSGLKNRVSYFVNKTARHAYFLGSSLADGNLIYRYYMYAELRSFIDFVVLNREPQEYV